MDVVNDQVGNPTYAGDLSEAILRIVESGLYGTYHAVNAGPTSWFEFARAVAQAFGLDPATVRPTTADQFVRPAPRPAHSALRTFVLEESLGHRMRPWTEALADYARAVERGSEASA